MFGLAPNEDHTWTLQHQALMQDLVSRDNPQSENNDLIEIIIQ